MGFWEREDGRPTLGARIHAGFAAGFALVGAGIAGIVWFVIWLRGEREGLLFAGTYFVFLSLIGLLFAWMARGGTFLSRGSRARRLKEMRREQMQHQQLTEHD